MGKTSRAVRDKYDKAHYKMLPIRLEIDLVDRFRAECVKRGVSQASVVRAAIKEFLGKE